MAEELLIFNELEEPVECAGHGWYVGCVDKAYETYYLHNDGVIYDTCGPRIGRHGHLLSTGWHATEMEALIYSQGYYNKYGLAYPYNIPVAAGNKKESQVMEFV